MEREDRAALSGTASIVVASAVYLSNPPAPAYYPLEHAFHFGMTGGIGMDWYGRSLWAIVAGTTAFGLAWLATRRFHAGPPISPRLRAAFTLLALGVLIATLGDVAWRECSTWMI